MNFIKPVIQRFSKIPSYPLLTVLAMGFTVFTSLSFFYLNWNDSNQKDMNQKAEHLSSLIISTNLENMMDYNTAAIRSSVESFMNDMDIESMTVKDGANTVLASVSRKTYRTKSVTVKKPFTIENMKIGTLELVVSNASKWKKTDQIAELIASSSIDHIWDYNISSLKSSARSFFKNKDIKALFIKEESGLELVRLERSTTGSEELKITKKLYKDKHYIGTIDIIFCDCIAVTKQQVRKIKLTAFIILAFIFGIALILLTRSNQLKRKEIKADKVKEVQQSRQPLHWSISESTEEKMEQAIAFLKENYTSTLSREGLASMLNLNPDNMGRYFKLYTGERINDFINRLRVEEAANRLEKSVDNIVHIAFAVGFENISTFNRAFQKIMKETPTEFRKKHQPS